MKSQNEKLTKDDLSFLVPIMEQKKKSLMSCAFDRDEIISIGARDNVNGDISIPEPVVVDVKGDMTLSDYKACSTIMAVCQNMIQKTIADAARVAGVETALALKNMNAWVEAYVEFPFPFFNFKDTQSDVFVKNQFSFDTDPDVVEKIVNIKGVDGLKDAIFAALHKSAGNIVSYEGTDRDFNYFGIITGYRSTEISFRAIKFAMHLKETNVKTLCGRTSSTKLNTSYDTYQFVADKELMIKMQQKMGDKLVEYFADQLLTFMKTFYDDQLLKFNQKLVDLFQKG